MITTNPYDSVYTGAIAAKFGKILWACAFARHSQAQHQAAARLGAMMSSVFGAHKGAWIAAGAAACAVALIMSQFGTTERVIERQIIVVESVDQLDQNNLVLVNSLKDDNTAVIWTLPNVNSQEQAPAEESQDDDDVVIVDEPL